MPKPQCGSWGRWDVVAYPLKCFTWLCFREESAWCVVLYNQASEVRQPGCMSQRHPLLAGPSRMGLCLSLPQFPPSA